MYAVTNAGTSFMAAMLLRVRRRRLLFGSRRESQNGGAARTHGSTSKCNEFEPLQGVIVLTLLIEHWILKFASLAILLYIVISH